MAVQDVKGRPLSYFQAPTPSVQYKRTINDRIRELAQEAPDKVAFVFRHPNKPRTSLTRQEFVDKVTVMGQQLVNLGIKPGDKVAVLMPSSEFFLIVQFGLFMAGAISVNSLSQDERELTKMASDLGCAAKIVQNIENSGDEATKRIMVSLKKNPSEYGSSVNILQLLQKPPAESVLLPKVSNRANAIMALTSGSSGAQKLVAHTHRTVLLGAFSIGNNCGLTSHDTVLMDRPMQWMGGYPLIYLGTGSTTLYVISRLSRFEDDEFFVDVNADELPSCSMLMVYRLNSILKDPKLSSKMPHLEKTIAGGQRVTANTIQLMLKLSDEVILSYGSTESFHFAFSLCKDAGSFVDGTVGVFTEGAEVKIIDDATGVVPVGNVGELCIRGDGCAKEYISLTGESTITLDEEDWYHTGDMATMNADGLVVIQGRKTEMIKRATVKISPVIVETKLQEKLELDIEEVAVVGIADDRLYQELCACIILKPQSSLTQADIIKKAEDIFKPSLAQDGLGLMPGHFLIMEDFPRTASSKLARSQLATDAAETVMSRMGYENI